MVKITFKSGSTNGPVVQYPAHSVQFNDDGTISLLDTDDDIVGMINADVWEDVWIFEGED